MKNKNNGKNKLLKIATILTFLMIIIVIMVPFIADKLMNLDPYLAFGGLIYTFYYIIPIYVISGICLFGAYMTKSYQYITCIIAVFVSGIVTVFSTIYWFGITQNVLNEKKILFIYVVLSSFITVLQIIATIKQIKFNMEYKKIKSKDEI